MTTSPFEENAEEKWLILAITVPTYEVVPLFLKSEAMVFTSDYHRRFDENKYLLLRQHLAINNSDRGGSNALLKVVRATRKKSKVLII